MNYKIFIEKSAQKDLSKIPLQHQNRIIAAIQLLAKKTDIAKLKVCITERLCLDRLDKFLTLWEFIEEKYGTSMRS